MGDVASRLPGILYHVVLSVIATYCVYYFFRDVFKTSFVMYGQRNDADVTPQERPGIVRLFWICVTILSAIFAATFASLQYFAHKP